MGGPYSVLLLVLVLTLARYFTLAPVFLPWAQIELP